MPTSTLFNMFGNNNGFMNMLNQFNKFKQSFNGDPKQQVQQLLNSGQMSQEQFQQLSNAASQFQQLMGRRY